MVFGGERYFNVYRITFTILGLWPYQKQKILRIQAVFFFSVFFSVVCFQLTPLATTECDMECIIKKVSYICITAVYILNYYCFYFNARTIKQSLEHMQLDWKMLENKNAMKILDEYIYEAYLFTITVLIILILGVFIFTIFECIPIFLDVFLPLNESRLRKTEVSFEYFLDDQQYFCLYVLHEFISLLVGISSMGVTGSYLLVISTHTCAIYKVASALMQGTVTEHVLQIPAPERMYFMYNNIRLSVHIHRRNMKFIDGILLSFQFWYFPLVIISVVSLSCVFFRLFNALKQFNDYYDFAIAIIIFCFHFVYMFVVNLFGQLITDYSAEILTVTYNTLWYLAPLEIQKLLLFMHRSIKDHKLVAAGFFTPSIEGFSTLITTAISYFTVMHAMRS